MMSMKVGQVAVASLRVRRLQASVLIADLAVRLSLSEQGDTEVARGVAAVCPRPIRLAENLRRRKSSSSKHFPQPTPVPQNSHQLIEISSTLKESPVRWRSLMSSEMSSDQSSKVKDIVRISGVIENVDLQLRIELSFQPCK
jgi:hypothetical protein